MPLESFSHRWLVLGMFSLATSMLLTIGIAIFSLRDTASASVAAERPTPRASSGTTLITIGGSARTPTPAPGSAPVAVLPPSPDSSGSPIQSAPQRSAEGPAAESAMADRSVPGPQLAAVAAEPPAEAEPSTRGAAAAPAPAASATRVPTPTVGYTPIPSPIPPSPTAQPTETPLPAPTETAVPTPVADAPPSIVIRLSDERAERGDRVSIAVSAVDDRGLDWIAWEGTNTDDSQLGRERRADCHDRERCGEVWTVTANQPGTYRLAATARDSRGQRATASAELRVREQAPPTPTRTSTPTRTPTPRPGPNAARGR